MSTLDDVATLAKVSKATVSRVVNQRGNVHPDTVRVVRAAMDHTKYQPPSFKAGRVGSVDRARDLGAPLSAYALVVPQIAGGLYVSLLGGFEASANERYRQSIICNTHNNVYRQGHELLQLVHKRVSGVAIVPVAEVATPLSHVQALQSAGIPVVLLHRDIEGAACPLIALPLEDVGYRAGKEIVAKGHRRVAMLTVPQGPSSLPQRRGFQRALEEAGLSLPDELVQTCPSPASLSLQDAEASIHVALDRLLSLPVGQRPTAIYATNDTLAELVYLQLIDRGMLIPDQMSIVSFGSKERSGAVVRRLTSVVVDEVSVGRLAVDFLEEAAADPGAAFRPERLTRNVAITLSEGSTLGSCTR